MALSYTHESDFRQERDFGQKISATFEFLRVHWRPLGRVLLYLVVPVALLQSVLSSLLQSQLLGMRTKMLEQSSGGVLGMQQAMFKASFANPWYYLSNIMSTTLISMLVLSIYGYLLYCLRPDGEAPATITAAEVWVVVKRWFISTFFSFYGVGFLIMLGMIALLIPGLYLSVVLSLFFIVRMVEGTGFGTTLNRCVSLVKGKWWSTFGLIIIMIVILYLLLIGVGIVVGLLGTMLRGGFAVFSADTSILAVITTSLTTFFLLILYPPLLLALAFQYFNLVERHEGVGLHRLVGQLGQVPLASPSGDTYRPTEEGEY